MKTIKLILFILGIAYSVIGMMNCSPQATMRRQIIKQIDLKDPYKNAYTDFECETVYYYLREIKQN